ARPLVWLLSRSTNLAVRLLGGDPAQSRGVMTDEELRDLVAGHQALSPDERHIVSEVFDAGKRQIREVLVPRTEVEFLPASMPLTQAIAATEHARYSRFPVYQESYDDVIGFVHTRDLLDNRSGLDSRQIGEVCRPVKFLPISKMVLSALSEMAIDQGIDPRPIDRPLLKRCHQRGHRTGKTDFCGCGSNHGQSSLRTRRAQRVHLVRSPGSRHRSGGALRRAVLRRLRLSGGCLLDSHTELRRGMNRNAATRTAGRERATKHRKGPLLVTDITKTHE
ncbi:MAG: CBS domain-containing protein, partial [Planctomycetes bacterium]|nr:CBS domain-containing protein [Planctomycetota bacterium]